MITSGYPSIAAFPIASGRRLRNHSLISRRIPILTVAPVSDQNMSSEASPQEKRISSDEEGYSTWGTPRIIDWLNERGIRPDMILIGEPTSVDRLGDTIKIGRRGSVNMWIEVPGVQGHVAYPHRTTNPIPQLARVIAALDALHLDDGTEQFPPSNLEFTSISTPTHATRPTTLLASSILWAAIT